MTDTFNPSRLLSDLKGNVKLRAVYEDIETRMPAPLRPLAYALTALPAPETAMPEFDPVEALLRDTGLLLAFGAVAGTAATLAAGGILPLMTAPVALYASLGVTGRLRRASVGHVHEAGHGVVTKHLVKRGFSKEAARQVTAAIMDAASIVSLTTNGEDYASDHKDHHDERYIGTIHDPDGAGNFRDGFWRGEFESRREFYTRLASTLVNPVWHLRKIQQRLHSNLVRGTKRRRLRAAGMLATLGASSLVLPLPFWIMAVALPWTAFYNAASLLQVLTKHTYGHDKGAPGVADQARRCHERIPYHLMPQKGAGAGSWMKWALKIALIDIPSRLAVLDSTMVAHGFHHMAWPAGHAFNDWTNTARRMIDYRCDENAMMEAATPVLLGLDVALQRQARFMTRSR